MNWITLAYGVKTTLLQFTNAISCWIWIDNKIFIILCILHYRHIICNISHNHTLTRTRNERTIHARLAANCISNNWTAFLDILARIIWHNVIVSYYYTNICNIFAHCMCPLYKHCHLICPFAFPSIHPSNLFRCSFYLSFYVFCFVSCSVGI